MKKDQLWMTIQRRNKCISICVFLFISISSFFGTCREKDPDGPWRAVNTAIGEAIQDTRANMANGKTSKDIGQRIIDSLEIRRTQLNELYLKIKLGSTDSTSGKGNTIYKNPKIKSLGLTPEGKNTINQFTIMIVSTLRSVETMKRLYNLDKFNRYNSALFFEPGEYVIPEKNVARIIEGLEPLLKDVLYAINNDTNRQVKIVIGVYGYSDDQDVLVGNKLYNDLISKINSDTAKEAYSNLPLSQQLNYKLSQLRAENLTIRISRELDKRRNQKKNKDLLYEVNWIGLGNDVPAGVENPQKSDPRRRIVAIYWDVMPSFQLDDKLRNDVENIEEFSTEYKKTK
jgi:hypothetical protein